jgi:hypothetical protein
MEYTKDIILDVMYKRNIETTKVKCWFRKLGKGIKNNGMIITIIAMLAILTAIDIMLVNSFFTILAHI